MKVANVKPGLIVYTCLIQTCIGGDRIEKAEELFRQMKGERVKPDAVMFATLIKGQLRQQRYPEALNMALKMVEEKPLSGPRSDPYSEVLNKFRQCLNT